jgi:hypothetical protein
MRFRLARKAHDGASMSDSLGSHKTKNKQDKNNLLLIIPESGFYLLPSQELE